MDLHKRRESICLVCSRSFMARSSDLKKGNGKVCSRRCSGKLRAKYRIEKTLLGIDNTFGSDRFVCISRELTKIHETFHIGRVCDVRDKMIMSSSKGEFTLVVAPEGYTL